MANTLPVNDNAAVTQFILEKASLACGVRLYPVGAITQGLEGKTLAEIGEMKKAGIVAISDDGKTVMDARLVRRAMEYAKGFDLPMIVHCEDAQLKDGTHMNEGRVSTELGIKGSPNCTEDIIAAREIHLSKLTGCHVHITHVSSAGTLSLVRQAKKEGLHITCDVTPHHLYFTDEAIKTFNTDFKVNPPLRTIEDQSALWQGLADGTIDAIATDHAPHADREKKLEFEFANCGMIGFETALNVALYLVERKIIPMEALPRLMSTSPAKIMGFPDASIAVGNKADLTLFDAQKEIAISPSHFFSKSKNSPFIGETLKGEVRTTIVDGQVVYPF
jgi:dihydroorotase